jgi:DNA-binding CsgD family transcriptional regulator/tetratricopeptide (TPR) repeat protein
MEVGRVASGPTDHDMRLCPTMVGREDLVALARRRWTAALAGSGRLLFLAGEAGIGKTRLLREISEQAAADGFAVVGAATFPQDVESAGGVLFDLAGELRRCAEPVVAAAGVALAARLAEAPDPGDDAYRRRRLLVAGLADALVSAAAGPTPLLLTLEDLHWADVLTLEVLDRLARRIDTLPMLAIATYRSDELYPKVAMRGWRARLLRQRQAEEARLSRLDRTQTSEMSTLISRAVVPVDVADAVYQRSDGIPLHIEELLAGGDGVPDTLVEAVLTRAQALTGPTLALVRAAAVIGRSFDIDLVTAIVAAEAVSPAVVDAGLRELVDRYFIVARGDGLSYDFRNALIRDALYADLTPLRRRELHAQVAGAAVAAGLRDAFVSDHYERAGQAGPAHRYALTAAAEAVSLSSHREAVDLYRRAWRTTPTATGQPERADLLAGLADALAATDDNAPAADLYAQAYQHYGELGDDAAAATLMPRLVAVRHLLGAGLDERAGLLRQALSRISYPTAEGSTPDIVRTQARLLAALAAAYMLDRRLEEAASYGERARAMATAADDLPVLLNTDATVGSVQVFAGRMDAGWDRLRDTIRRATAAGIEHEAARGYRMIGSSASVLVEYDLARHWLGEGIEYAARTERWNDHHYMAAHLAHVRWATGDWVEADRTARQAQADGRSAVTTAVTALHVLGYLALGRSDFAAATAHLSEARSLGQQMNEPQRLSPALWGLAEVALHSGQTEAAVDWCEQGYATSASVRDAAYLYPFVVTGTRAYLRRGDPVGARGWVERTAELLDLRGIPGTGPARPHARGLLLLAEGQTGQARAALTEARAGWQARQRFWEGTQVLVDLARCAHRSRRPADSTALLAQARDRATAAGATTLLTLIAAETPAGGGRTSRPGADGLSAREIEVAHLIATGATNREIATTLTIAPKTVAAHVEHILTKLGAGRRSEIAAWATVHARSDHPGG